MKLDVSLALKNPGQEYLFRGEQAIAPQEISGDTVTFDDAILEGTYFATDDGSVQVDGKLTTVAHAHCANCLEPASADIQATFRETFLRNGDPEDDEIFVYTGSCVGFEKLAMSYAVLALPMRFLCREDCPGLVGFADNDTCQKEMQNEHPFAALQQLLTKDEEV
jgi:uncharacterized protein